MHSRFRPCAAGARSAGTFAAFAATLLLGASPAFAQSSAIQEIETVVVTVEQANMTGVLAAESVPKARAALPLGADCSAPLFAVGAPQTFQATLRSEF